MKRPSARNTATFFHDLSVGQTATELRSPRTSTASRSRLSDLKGKVVVLDVWSTVAARARR